MTLVLKNVRGLSGEDGGSDTGKWSSFLEEFRNSMYDAALITEHKIPLEDKQRFVDAAALRGLIAIVGGNEQGAHSGGTAIVVREEAVARTGPSDKPAIEGASVMNGRVTWADVQIRKSTYRLP